MLWYIPGECTIVKSVITALTTLDSYGIINSHIQMRKDINASTVTSGLNIPLVEYGIMIRNTNCEWILYSFFLASDCGHSPDRHQFPFTFI